MSCTSHDVLHLEKSHHFFSTLLCRACSAVVVCHVIQLRVSHALCFPPNGWCRDGELIAGLVRAISISPSWMSCWVWACGCFFRQWICRKPRLVWCCSSQGQQGERACILIVVVVIARARCWCCLPACRDWYFVLEGQVLTNENHILRSGAAGNRSRRSAVERSWSQAGVLR